MDDIKPRTTSPVMTDVVIEDELYDFPEATRRLVNGDVIARKAWNNNDYCQLLNGKLMIYREEDKQIHQWIINDGDLTGTDWYTVKTK